MLRRENGQATIEMLGVLPALLVAGLAAWQLVLVGHAAWMAAGAARTAARAELVGKDAGRAARSALPAALEEGLEVERTPTGATRVRLPVPVAHPAWRSTAKLSAAASLKAAR